MTREKRLGICTETAPVRQSTLLPTSRVCPRWCESRRRLKDAASQYALALCDSEWNLHVEAD